MRFFQQRNPRARRGPGLPGLGPEPRRLSRRDAPGSDDLAQPQPRLGQPEQSIPRPRQLGGAPQFPQTPLRFRRVGGGYHPDDVELLLAECRLAVRQLERRLMPLRERERELEDQLHALRAELAAARGRRAEVPDQLAVARAHAGKIEQLARDQSVWAMLLTEHEPVPPGGEPSEVRAKLNELLRLNDELLTNVKVLEAELLELEERLRPGAVRPAEPGREPAPEPEPPVAAEGPEQPVSEEEPEVEPEPEPEPVMPPEPPAAEVPQPLPEPPAPEPAPRVLPSPREPEAERASPACSGQLQRGALGGRLPLAPAGVSGLAGPILLTAVAVVLVVAVALAAVGQGTAAVTLLAAFALLIALLSVFGIARSEGGSLFPTPPAAQAAIPPPTVEREESGVAPTGLERELVQLAGERVRQLLEFEHALERGDRGAAERTRSRLQELDELMAERGAELTEGPGDEHEEQFRPRWQGRRLVNNLDRAEDGA